MDLSLILSLLPFMLANVNYDVFQVPNTKMLYRSQYFIFAFEKQEPGPEDLGLCDMLVILEKHRALRSGQVIPKDERQNKKEGDSVKYYTPWIITWDITKD